MIVYNWYELLYSVFIYTVVIPIILGLIRWRSLTRTDWWVIAFLVALLLDELLSVLCIALHLRNHFLYHIQTVTVLCSIAGVYNGTIGSKRLLWRIAIGVSLLMIVEVTCWVGFNHINSVTLAVSRLLPAVYAIITMHRLYSVRTHDVFTHNSRLYIHWGFFLFGAFTTVNACFTNYFLENSLDLFFLFQNMSAMISSVAFGLFSIAFLRLRTDFSMQVQR